MTDFPWSGAPCGVGINLDAGRGRQQVGEFGEINLAGLSSPGHASRWGSGSPVRLRPRPRPRDRIGSWGLIEAGLPKRSGSRSSPWSAKSTSAGYHIKAKGCSRLDLEHASRLVEEFRDSCATPTDLLRLLVDAMVADMEEGLGAEGRRLKMLPSFVERLPTGEETGVYYALDLGGTNFRVLRAELGGAEHRLVKQDYKEVSIPSELMIGDSDSLFDFIAGKLAEFVAFEERNGEDAEHAADRKRELGFTFSFPVNQTSIASGTLIHWSKGFNVPDTVGKDIVEVLREAIGRQGLDMRVAALVNDTVGTLAGGRYWNSDVMVAVILGTGTNACYVERAEAVGKWTGPLPQCGTMVINTEWGNFGSDLLPLTFADKGLDQDTVNPGDHGFEKLISGLYLGDLVRRFMLHLATEAGLFGDSIPDKLLEKFSLSTPDISKMQSDATPDLDVVAAVLKDRLGMHHTSLAERKIVVTIIDFVARRGARLAAAGVVGILKKIGRDTKPDWAGKTVVAMDGGLYEHYTQFRAYLHGAVSELLGEEVAESIDIALSKDGSGIGAALLAACHAQN